ncbi:esterase family protein [Actinomadura sp. GC306]|uniref:alpha/beta hydrolase n=1 Tax=Actinomadura sp. GC306 TaxID=2530367 RepID=UPI00104CEBCD|nr:alpha/beta hydrolase family protein [Actinomadura sp. GC306]TDC66368.1 esterase family protein [Actinomadura sp. GC306]
MPHRRTIAACTAALALLAPLVPAPAVDGSTARAATAPEVVSETAVASRTVDLTIDSPAMGRTENVRLLLPPGWTRDTDRTWPTLWLLHGGVDGYTAWTRDTDVAELTARTGVIVVMPNGGRCGNYSDWWNYGNGGTPQWETFHMTELRRILERDYNAGQKRVIAGNSMGGLGAMLYAARFPGMFEAAAAFSGYLDTLLDHEPGKNSTGWGPALACPGTDWRRVWGHPDDQAAVWHAHNPADLAERLRGVRLWVASGNGKAGPLGGFPFTDPVEAATYDHARSFTKRLRDLGIPVTTHFFDGQHDWPYWERELHRAYPALLDALGVAAGR